jgi:hypothetical protein
MNLPHERCNYLMNDEIVLVGAKPTTETLPKIIDWGVTIFVNLTDDPDGLWYIDLLPRNILHIHLPVINGQAPSLKSAKDLIFYLMEAYHLKQKI